MKNENGKWKIKNEKNTNLSNSCPKGTASVFNLFLIATLPRHTDYPMDNEKIK